MNILCRQMLLLVLMLVMIPAQAFTIDYDTVFPTVIQGHGNNTNCAGSNATTFE